MIHPMLMLYRWKLEKKKKLIVSFMRNNIPKYSSSNGTTLVTRTEKIVTSVGVQAEQGFYIDHEVRL